MSAAGATVLHVAALPFPSHQGTQAVIAEMLSTLSVAGRKHELLCYAHAGDARALPFTVHRAREPFAYRSLRSGPSLHKLLADACLGRALLRHQKGAEPGLIVAHHVEAAALSLSAPAQVFFAHTDLRAELPTYLSPLLRALLAGAGGRVDRALVQRACAVAAISPLLAERLQASTHEDKVYYVPPPWPLAAPISDRERAQSRSALGLWVARGMQPKVLLYAGNLDRYQGWEEVVRAAALLAGRMPELRLIVGTLSNPSPLWRMAQRCGIADRLRVSAVDSEPSRRALYAAADLVVVPRRAAGGLPIKLLDAMARGVPCVVMPTATAGLSIGHAVVLAERADAAALAAAIALAAAHPDHGLGLASAGRQYVAVQHSAAAFLGAFDAVIERAQKSRRAKRKFS